VEKAKWNSTNSLLDPAVWCSSMLSLSLRTLSMSAVEGRIVFCQRHIVDKLSDGQ
jgi:hypothetical protein